MEFLAIVALYLLTLVYLSYKDKVVSEQMKNIIKGLNNEEIDKQETAEETLEPGSFDEIVGLEDVSPEDLLKLKQWKLLALK